MIWRPVDRRGALPDPPSTTRHRRSPFSPPTRSLPALAPRAVVVAVVAAIVLFALPWRASRAVPRDAATPARSFATLDPPTGASTRGAHLAPSASRAPSTPLAGDEDTGALAAETLATRAPRLVLTLVDEGGAVRTAGATLELRGADGSVETHFLAEADASGAASIALAAGELELVAWRDGLVAGPSTLAVAAGGETRARLVLRTALPVSGRVFDERDGAPLAGASIRFWTFAEADVARTDACGTFTHRRFPIGPDLHQVRVEAPGYGAVVRYLSFERNGRWALYSDLAGKPEFSGRDGRPWLVFSLARASVLEGRVVDQHGAAISGAQVLAEGYVRTLDGVATRDATTGVTDADGRFALSELRADVGHGVRVHAPGYAVTVLETEPGVHALGTVVLQTGRAVSGSVFLPCGAPAADVVVELVDSAGPAPLPASPSDAALRLDCARRRARTDDNGVFLFEDVADRAASVRVLVDGLVACAGEVAHGDGSGIVLQLPPRSAAPETDAPALALNHPLVQERSKATSSERP